MMKNLPHNLCAIMVFAVAMVLASCGGDYWTNGVW